MLNKFKDAWENYRSHFLCVILTIATGVFIPAFIFFLVRVIVLDISPLITFKDFFSDRFTDHKFSFTLFMIEFLPFATLSLFLFLQKKKRLFIEMFILCIFGLIGILALMVPAYYSYWKAVYSGSETSSTGALLFVFVPIYCLVPLSISLLVGKLVTHRIFKNNEVEPKIKKSRMAIISLILAILSFINLFGMEFLCLISSLILAILAIIKIKNEKGLLTGMDLVIIGISLCVINVCYKVYLLWNFFNIF